MLQAKAAALPPEEPAGVFVRSNGLEVAPYTKFFVLPPAPNSGVFVLQKIIAPSLLISSTIVSSLSGILFS